MVVRARCYFLVAVALMDELRRNRDLVSEVLARAQTLTDAAAAVRDAKEQSGSPDKAKSLGRSATKDEHTEASVSTPTRVATLDSLPTAILQATLATFGSTRDLANAAMTCQALAAAADADYGLAWSRLCLRHFGVTTISGHHSHADSDASPVMHARPTDAPVLASGLGITAYFHDEVMDDLVDNDWVGSEAYEEEDEDEIDDVCAEDDEAAIGAAKSWRHVYRDRLYHWRQSIRQISWLHAHGAPSQVHGRRHRYELYVAMRYAALLTSGGHDVTNIQQDHGYAGMGVDGYDGYDAREAVTASEPRDDEPIDRAFPRGEWPHAAVVPLLRAGLVKCAMQLFDSENPMLREQSAAAVANAVQYADAAGMSLSELGPKGGGPISRSELAEEVSRILLCPGASPGSMVEASRLMLELGGCTVRVPSCELRRGLGKYAGQAVATRLGTMFDDDDDGGDGNAVHLSGGELDIASPEEAALAMMPWRFEIISNDGARSPRPMACRFAFSDDGETATWVGFEPTECAVGASSVSGSLGRWFHMYGKRTLYPGGGGEGASATSSTGCWDFHGHYDGHDGRAMRGAAISRRLVSDARGMFGHELPVKGDGEPLLISGGASRRRPARCFRVWCM